MPDDSEFLRLPYYWYLQTLHPGSVANSSAPMPENRAMKKYTFFQTWTTVSNGARMKYSRPKTSVSMTLPSPFNINSIALHPDHVKKLMTYLEKLEVDEGFCLIRQGAPARFLYFIESGEFTAQLELEEGETIRFRTMRPWSIFGEIGLYRKIPRVSSVIASKPNTFYRLSDTSLKKMETEGPGLSIAF